MTMLTARTVQRQWRRQRLRGRLVPILVGGFIAGSALAAVAYLLWPTWGQTTASQPDRIPVSVGATVFNVPVRAFRIKVQKHSGPQERVDLSFDYPSLTPPDAPRHVSADTVADNAQPIDRIFLAIAAHGESLAPDQRARTIYPRYLDAPSAPPQDGLSMRPFRDASPYAGEDLFFTNDPAMVARCTREGDTPGMCLSERRIDGADLTYRFPRQWLTDWREVATAMDRLTAQLHSPRG